LQGITFVVSSISEWKFAVGSTPRRAAVYACPMRISAETNGVKLLDWRSLPITVVLACGAAAVFAQPLRDPTGIDFSYAGYEGGGHEIPRVKSVVVRPWFNPATGQAGEEFSASGAAGTKFAKPDAKGWLLLLRPAR
jgi:hypothetical protein